MTRLSIAGAGFLLLGLAAMTTGCGSDNPVNPLANFQPEIINNSDNFEFQATALTSVTAVVTYDWDNSGTQASIDHSSAIASGTTLLEVLDANDVIVYSDSLRASGTDQSTPGTTGTWTVRVTLTGVDGTLNFRAQKL